MPDLYIHGLVFIISRARWVEDKVILILISLLLSIKLQPIVTHMSIDR